MVDLRLHPQKRTRVLGLGTWPYLHLHFFVSTWIERKIRVRFENSQILMIILITVCILQVRDDLYRI